MGASEYLIEGRSGREGLESMGNDVGNPNTALAGGVSANERGTCNSEWGAGLNQETDHQRGIDMLVQQSALT